MYSPKVGARFFVSGTTLDTRQRIRPNPTHFFYAAESESDNEIYGTLSNYQSIVTVGDAVESSISTIQAEILELDTIGFDETLPHEETLDI
jgi:hypothetical protein